MFAEFHIFIMSYKLMFLAIPFFWECSRSFSWRVPRRYSTPPQIERVHGIMQNPVNKWYHTNFLGPLGQPLYQI